MRKYRLPRLETRPRIATALTPGTGPPPPFSWPTPGRLDRDGADWLHLWLREPFVKASRFPRGRVAGRSPVRFRSPAWQSLPVAGLPPAYLAGVGANGSAPAFLLDALPGFRLGDEKAERCCVSVENSTFQDSKRRSFSSASASVAFTPCLPQPVRVGIPDYPRTTPRGCFF